jgi:hypothetical protein
LAVLAALLLGPLVLPTAAPALEYFSPDNKIPSPLYVWPGYPILPPPPEERVLLGNGMVLRHLALAPLIRESPTAGPPAAVDSFFDIFIEVSTDGGGTFSPHSALAAPIQIRESPVLVEPPKVDMEILSLSASASGGGGGGILIRESPTRVSSGFIDMDSVPGGYMVSSFFDIFIEVSTDGGQSWATGTQYSPDGGQTWQPGEHPLRVEGVPEPGTMLLLAIGGLVVLGRACCRMRRR